MEPKEKIETYLKLLEINQTGFEGRRNVEWTVMGLLWTGILVCTGFMYDKGLSVNWWVVIPLIIFICVFFIWLGFLARANEIDKEFRKYYRDMVYFLLGIEPEPKKPTEVEERLKKPKFNDKWQITEFVITLALLFVSMCVLI